MKASLLTILVGTVLLNPSNAMLAAEDILIANFEGTTYGSWRTTGEAFGPGPARGTLPGQMPVEGFQGKGLVNSFHQGDGTTGTLTSPPFTIQRRFIAFLIGGGKDSEKTCMNLLIDGKAVRNATGPNDKPGGSEALAPDSWDVGEFIGKTAVIQIVDQAQGGWGHINVDHIVQTDRRPPGMVADAKREFQVETRYLNLPIKNGAPKRVVSTLVDGRIAVRNEIELANTEPDWWAPMDVSAWRGKRVTLQVDKLPEDSTALSSIEPGDSIKGAENLYRELSRGQFHFSARRGWNNDPNGLVFYRGEYHLFFQHNPYGWNWGNMHWGHAVSRDLVHWRELGDVLLPDELGPMFSGSAVVDWANTSGLGEPAQPAQVLIYTAAGNPTVQCLASSTDGRTYTKFSGNPVVNQITGGNRDPKVIWHQPTKRWVMTLYVETNEVHTIHFLTSPNLKEWTVVSKTDGFFECPDFFELPVDGAAAEPKWILTAASSEYMVGRFDGAKFTPETPKLKGHRGRGFYAAQTFSDIPANDGRRIQIGWFQTPTPGMPFNQSMTIPMELKLVSTPDGPRLTWTPVKELTSLRARAHRFDPATLQPGDANPLAGVRAELVELRVEFEPGDASEVAFTVRGAAIDYDTRMQELVVNGHRAPAPLRAGRQRLTIYCDRAGLEVFASDGLTYVPMPFIPKADDLGLALQAKGASVKINALEVHELGSTWGPQATAERLAIPQSGSTANLRAAPADGSAGAVRDTPVDLESAVAWLERRAKEMIRDCRRTMTNGMAAFPPQVGGGYEAFWLRDYAYMLEGNRRAFSHQELKDAYRFFLAGQRADGAMVDCIKFDGTPIYMPGYGTIGRNPVADGSQFMVDVAWQTFQQTRDTNLIAQTSDALLRGMRAVPRNPATGLVHIKRGPEHDRCPYGFTDAIRKQGDELFCSLLFVQASRQLADLLEAARRKEEAQRWRAEAEQLSKRIREVFWDGTIGLFRAATAVCNQPDIWGSAFAVYLDVATPAQGQAVARYFKDHYAGIVKRGQVRHLPANMEWEQTIGVKPGTYQNGAYWATPVGWFVFTLHLADPELADQTVVDLVRDFIHTGDENECVNDGYANVAHYVVSAALPLDGIRAMRCRRAASAGQDALSARAPAGGMQADSPVTFPREGALPARYPPDVEEQSEPAEEGYYIFSTPCRSLAQIDTIQREMPKGEFASPPADWTYLRRTRRILTAGGNLRLLALGDSIVNDTMRSGWVARLQGAYPKARIKATVYVRGGGGCQHYREDNRVAKYILPRQPDLVFIGGISQKDIDSVREVVHQLRAGLPGVEVILATGAFGTADPRNADELAKAPHSGTGAYGQALKALATAERCAYLDLTTPWAEYIRSSKLHPHRFYRDAVHANEFGEQILAKILMAFFESAKVNEASMRGGLARNPESRDFHPPADSPSEDPRPAKVRASSDSPCQIEGRTATSAPAGGQGHGDAEVIRSAHSTGGNRISRRRSWYFGSAFRRV